MSAETNTENFLEDNEDISRLVNEARIKKVSSEIRMLTAESKMTSEKIKDLQSSSDCLKSEIQRVVNKIEKNIDTFRGKLSKKIVLILHLLSDKQTHIQCALDNCFAIISHLVETFLAIGHELEKDIAAMTLKVNSAESEISKVVNISETNFLKLQTDNKGVHWFINSEGRLTKQKYSVFGHTLPEFKCGDKNLKEEFIWHMSEVFKEYQVPETQWVKLATSQFAGVARDWWRLNCDNDNNSNWKQFCSAFIDWEISNSGYTDFNNNFNNVNHNGNNFMNNHCPESNRGSSPASSSSRNSNKSDSVKDSEENVINTSENCRAKSKYCSCDECGTATSLKNNPSKMLLGASSNHNILESNLSELKKGLEDFYKADYNELSCGDESLSKLFQSDSEENASEKDSENSDVKRRKRE